MTLYLDPSFDSSKFRTEFRLPKQNGVYKSDFRILNLGLDKTDNGNSEYNQLVGAYGVVENIQIMSGAQLLDQVRHFDYYSGLKALMHSNSENMSLKRPLQHNKLGFVATGNQDVSKGAYANGIKITNAVPDDFNVLHGADASSKAQASDGGWFDLKACLGFLDASPYVPMNAYPDLRIVINYKPDQSNNVLNSNIALATKRPILVADYETDPEVAMALMREYRGVAFQSIEHERVRVPAVSGLANDTTSEQERSYLVKAFNSKYISKMVIVQTPTQQDTWRTANVNTKFADKGSVSQFQEKYQLRVNGQNIFARANQTGKMNTLGKMVDSFGDLNLTAGMNYCDVAGGATAIYSAGIVSMVGQADYLPAMIDDVVSEMKLTYTRTAVGPTAAGAATDNANLRQALDLNIYAMSRKQIVPTADGVVVRYV